MTAQGTMAERRLTWVVVADGSRARVLTYSAHDTTLRAHHEWLAPGAHAGPGDVHPEHVGSAHASAAHARHAKNPQSDPHNRGKIEFAKEVAHRIEEANRRREFDALVLVAPGHVLGEIRRDFSKAVHDNITCELAKDLTKTSTNDLPDLLAKEVAFPPTKPTRHVVKPPGA